MAAIPSRRKAIVVTVLAAVFLLLGFGVYKGCQRDPDATPTLSPKEVTARKQAVKQAVAQGQVHAATGDTARAHGEQAYAKGKATEKAIKHLRPTLHARIKPLTPADSVELADSLFRLLTEFH